MKNYLLAWRNLWRNRRRTMITAASVLFAVFFALLMRSMQLGSYDHMFKNAIESYTGYIQIQHKDWWDDQTVDNSFTVTDSLRRKLESDKNVVTTIPRFESFALASVETKTKGVMVMGIDPDKENLLSKVKDKKVKYRITGEAVQEIENDDRLPEKTREVVSLFEDHSYTNAGRLLMDLKINTDKKETYLPILESHASFKNGDIRMGEPGVWLGDNLSRYLGMEIGDTLVLISQGYHATTAAGKYEIKGIVKQPVPDVDSRVVYMPVDMARQFYNAGQNLTSIAVHLEKNDEKEVTETRARLAEKLEEPLVVKDWKEMNELLIQQMEADNKSGIIMIAILYLVIAFGVFGTILMMTAERRREMGVLVAIGMQKRKLAAVVSYEMIYIGIMGILAGVALAIPFILYGQHNPIVFKGEMALMFEDYGFEPLLAFKSIDRYFLWQMAVVGLIVVASLTYPLSRIFRLKVVNALKA